MYPEIDKNCSRFDVLDLAISSSQPGLLARRHTLDSGTLWTWRPGSGNYTSGLGNGQHFQTGKLPALSTPFCWLDASRKVEISLKKRNTCFCSFSTILFVSSVHTSLKCPAMARSPLFPGEDSLLDWPPRDVKPPPPPANGYHYTWPHAEPAPGWSPLADLSRFSHDPRSSPTFSNHSPTGQTFNPSQTNRTFSSTSPTFSNHSPTFSNPSPTYIPGAPQQQQQFSAFGSENLNGGNIFGYERFGDVLSEAAEARRSPVQTPVSEFSSQPSFSQPGFAQYDPFRTELRPRLHLPRFQPPSEPPKPSYSDIIRKSSENPEPVQKPKLSESRSLPLDRNNTIPPDRTSTRTPPLVKPKPRPTKTRSSDDMYSDTKPGKENHDIKKDDDITDSDGFRKPAKSQKEPKQEPYWDPKRIFQPKKTPKENVKRAAQSEVLNNGKCTSSFASTTKTAFINNDLRNRTEPKKRNNAPDWDTNESGESRPSEDRPGRRTHEPRVTDSRGKPESRSRDGSGDGPTTTTKPDKPDKPDRPDKPERERLERARDEKNEKRPPRRPEPRKQNDKKTKRTPKTQPSAWCLLAEQAGCWLRDKFWSHGWPALQFVPIIAFKILVLLFSILLYYMIKAYGRVRPYLDFSRFYPKRSSPAPPREGATRFGCGLECNIVLPSTGEEAIQRLLGCQGRDPYCILGLQGRCTDDDIKRYYRKQAILVHPDKNRQPGAEEAFKILHCAFEQIGTPEKRKSFDEEMRESSAAEEAAKRFGDLLTKWETKLREAANRMRCEKCEGTHQRYPIDRPNYAARHCSECKEYHMAKEGDCWAEATKFGFYWTYYACMDGNIYNITEWAKCQSTMFEKMRADSHHVIYTLGTGANQRKSQQKSANTGEAGIDGKDFEELLKFMAGGGIPKDFDPAQGQQGPQRPGTSDQPSWAKKRAAKGKKRRR